MIESVVWNLGSPNNDNGTYIDIDSDLLKAPYVYEHERANTNGKVCTSFSYCNDTVTRTSSWTGKVGLFYPSDFGYATSGGSAANRQTCLNTSMNKWNGTDVSDCKNNDWLYLPYDQWTMSPGAYVISSVNVNFIYYNGRIDGLGAYYPGGVFPVVFLKSSVNITSGSGTQSDPYILAMP